MADQQNNAAGSNLSAESENSGSGISRFFHSLDVTWRNIKKFRKIFLAIPVIIGAVWMAVKSNSVLPEYVGINLQKTGEYALTVSRLVAVFGPLAVTALCLLLMFCSRRTFYPWLISLFSLVLPLLLILTNTLV